jgi:hypothetical protein
VTSTSPSATRPAPKKWSIQKLSGVLRWLLHFLTYIYLLRFPLIAIIVIVAFLVKERGWAKMLAGAFDQSSFKQTFGLGLTNILFVYTLSVVGHNILGYSGLRGTAPELKKNRYETNAWHHLWNFVCAVTALPVPLTAWYYSKGSMAGTSFLAAITLGTFVGCIITTAVHVLRRLLVPDGHKKFDEKFPFMLIPKKTLEPLETSHGIPWVPDHVRKFFSKFKYDLTDGYLLKPPGQHEARLLPGHGLALAMMATFAVVYAVVGREHYGTAIVYILLLLTWLCWLFSGLAFFFDKYRIPILAMLVIFFAAAALSRRSDHYFQLSAVPAGSDSAVTSEYVLAERPHATERPIIVVAANGGGIQSAAWTARVLTGLAESLTPDKRQRFLESIRLISGVSGGSVGTMFFVNQIRPPDSGQSISFTDVVDEAEESGLEEVVWGMTYPDLGHAFFPWGRHDLLLDRGHALEEAWIKTARNHKSPPLDASLLDWNRGVMEGWRPATIFNATFVESGERLQISTSPVRDTKHAAGRQEFFDLFKGDIRIATAARLSASFPYVSPAARPTDNSVSALAPGTPDKYAAMHIVDGGYFDNSGLCALTEWLDEGLTERENLRKERNQPATADEKILVIEIRGFPNPGRNHVQPAANAQHFYDPLSVVLRRGWLYQLYAPVSTMMGVLGSGQEATNDTEFDLLQKYWGEKHIQIIPVIFQPDTSVCSLPDGPIPLSWHLRKQDKDFIKAAWDCELKNKLNCKAVADFIGQP